MYHNIKQSSKDYFSNSLVHNKIDPQPYDAVRQLHRSVGNQSAQNLFLGKAFRNKVDVGAANDQHEQQADQIANQIMNTSNSQLNLRSLTNSVFQKHNTQSNGHFGSGGRSLSKSEKNFFEPRFQADFSQVRLHDNQVAAESAKSINARAFTLGNDVVFGKNQYSSSSLSGKTLMAHELTHVVQQRTGASDPNTIQRTIELRPPGRGEASAFDRANEIIVRLNRISKAIHYSLAADGRSILYHNVFPSKVSNFDQQMMGFIDLQQVIPMRLITRHGRIGGSPVVIDSFSNGYVDLDDLMASDDLGFQSILVHFLQERAVTNRYLQRIGTPGLDSTTAAGFATFSRGHRAGRAAEVENFRDVFNDHSIVSNGERVTNAGTLIVIFRSATHNYHIFVTLRGAATSTGGAAPRSVTGANVTVSHQTVSYTVENFLNNGPLAAILRPPTPFNFPNLSGRRNLGFGLPPLSLGRGLTPPGSIFAPSPSLRLSPSFSPQLSPSLMNTQSNLSSILGGSFPVLSPNTNLINWLPIRSELIGRGVPFNNQMQSSIESLWITNYSFLSRIGLSRDQAVFWTNKTIPLAVGAGVNRDYPSLQEQMDRELNTSSIILPVSEFFRFLINR